MPLFCILTYLQVPVIRTRTSLGGILPITNLNSCKFTQLNAQSILGENRVSLVWLWKGALRVGPSGLRQKQQESPHEIKWLRITRCGGQLDKGNRKEGRILP